MEEYFKRSQEIKEEFLNSPLLEALNQYFYKKVKLERAGTGNRNIVYQVGKLENLHFALRKSGIFMTLNKYDLNAKYLEDYCQRAEKYFLNGQRVPNFCIGVNFNNELAVILLEDLTKNGEFCLLDEIGLEYGYRCKREDKDKYPTLNSLHVAEKEGKIERVYYDLDVMNFDDKRIEKLELRYFSNEAVIKIEG